MRYLSICEAQQVSGGIDFIDAIEFAGLGTAAGIEGFGVLGCIGAGFFNYDEKQTSMGMFFVSICAATLMFPPYTNTLGSNIVCILNMCLGLPLSKISYEFGRNLRTKMLF